MFYIKIILNKIILFYVVLSFTNIYADINITTTAVTSATEDSLYSYEIKATNSYVKPSTTSFSNLPSWLSKVAEVNATISAVATETNDVFDVKVGPDGSIYYSSYIGDFVKKIDTAGTTTTIANSTNINGPCFIDVDVNSTVYVADFENAKIQKIESNGTISTVHTITEGTASDKPLGVVIGPDNKLYFSLKFDHTVWKMDLDGSNVTKVIGISSTTGSDSNVLATNAKINTPMGLDFNSSGTLFVATYGDRVLYVDSNAKLQEAVSSASGLNNPKGIWFDVNDTLYIADTDNNKTKKWDGTTLTDYIGNGTGTTTGDGGVVSSATTFMPNGGTFDGAGNLYFTEYGGQKLRKVTYAKFSGTPLNANIGVSDVNLTVSDGNFTATQNFQITVSAKTVAAPVVVYTPPPDITPDSFYFVSNVNVEINSTVETSEITVNGINTNVNVTVEGAEFSINGGTYTSSIQSIYNSQKIKLRLTSSNEFNTTTTATLKVGSYSTNFKVTTRAKDITPDTFSFSDILDVNRSQSVEANSSITISGLIELADLNISGALYSLNGGDYTDVNLTEQIKNADTISIKTTSPNDYNSTKVISLQIGDFIETFKVTTKVQTVFIDGVEFSKKDIDVFENELFIANINGSGENITYSISNNELFKIEQDGKLYFKEPQDFETNSSLSTTVSVSDEYTKATQKLNIKIKDVNEKPYISSNLSANALINTFFHYKIFVTDPENSKLDINIENLPKWLTAKPLEFNSENNKTSLVLEGIALKEANITKFSMPITFSDDKFTETAELNLTIIGNDEENFIIFPVDVIDDKKSVYSVFPDNVIKDDSKVTFNNLSLRDSVLINDSKTFNNKKIKRYALKLKTLKKYPINRRFSFKSNLNQKSEKDFQLQLKSKGSKSSVKMNFHSSRYIIKMTKRLIEKSRTRAELIDLNMQALLDEEQKLILKWTPIKEALSQSLYIEDANKSTEFKLDATSNFAKLSQFEYKKSYKVYISTLTENGIQVSNNVLITMPEVEETTIYEEEYEKYLSGDEELTIQELKTDEFKRTLEIQKGWSLLGLPANLNLNTELLEKYFSDNNIEILYKYQNGFQVWQNVKNSEKETYATSDKFTSLGSKEAFWIKSNSDLNISFDLNPKELEKSNNSASNYLFLDSGWNLISADKEMSIEDLFKNIESSYGNYSPQVIWGYINNKWHRTKVENLNSTDSKFDTMYKLKDTQGVWLKL